MKSNILGCEYAPLNTSDNKVDRWALDCTLN